MFLKGASLGLTLWYMVKVKRKVRCVSHFVLIFYIHSITSDTQRGNMHSIPSFKSFLNQMSQCRKADENGKCILFDKNVLSQNGLFLYLFNLPNTLCNAMNWKHICLLIKDVLYSWHDLSVKWWIYIVNVLKYLFTTTFGLNDHSWFVIKQTSFTFLFWSSNILFWLLHVFY